MKLFLCLASIALSLGMVAAGRPSAGYLPPSYAGVGAAGSNQYPRYHGVSGVGGGGGHGGHHGQNGGVGGGAGPFQGGSHYGSNSAAAQIPILRNQYNNDGNGNYNFGFETGNGIKRDEVGHLQGGWPHGSLDVKGSYSYTGDDGKVYSVNYKADSNGFHAEGAHLPTPPPIPREIQETLHLHQRGPSASYGQHSSSGYHPGGGSQSGGGHHGAGGHGAGGHGAGSYGAGGHGAGGHGAGGHGAGGHGAGPHAAAGHFASASHHGPSAQYLPPSNYYSKRH